MPRIGPLLPLLATVLMPWAASAEPFVSELMASNDASLSDEDGDFPDWVEIHNPDPAAVDLTGWHLTDDPLNPGKWTFPSVSIPPGGFLVVFASDKNRTPTGGELHTNFKLTSGGEYLALVKPDGLTKASEFAPYPLQQTDVSYGLPQATEVVEAAIDTGSGLRFLVPTGTLAGWAVNGFDDAAWSIGSTGIGYERGSGYQAFINTDIQSAIYGINRTAYLRIPFHVDDPGRVSALTFLAKFDDGFAAYLNGNLIGSSNAPAGLAWNSGSSSSIEADLANYQSWDATALIPELVAGNNTLAIQLLNQSTTSSDLLMLPRLEITRTVEPSGGTFDFFTQPTPGALNNTPPGEPSGEVTLSVASGVKTAPIRVTMTTPAPDAEIRYTLDGSLPTESSALYSSPLALADPARLRARAFEPGKLGGPGAVGDYSFLDASVLGYLSDVPVVVMDNFGAGDFPNKGRSNDGHDVRQVPRQANVISLFEVSGNSQPFSQPPVLESRSGCRVRGSSSATFVRKPLSVEFWDDRDADLPLSPLGMEAEADWVLYAPEDQYDRPLIHNPVSFGFARLIGALSPESRVVVVFQNTDGGRVDPSDLAGVYVLMEKVERNRIGMNFKKMDDTGSSGGWMINIDRMAAIPVGLPADTIQPNFHAAGPDGILSIPDDEQNSGGSQSVDDVSEYYHSYLNFGSPDGYDILPAQRAAVQTDVRAMDAAVFSPDYADPLTGYRAHLDADSWARFYAVQNFAKNNDAIVLSTFIFRESPEDRIKMGPVWDFDRAYTWNGSPTSSPLIYSDRDWYQGLFQDINFKQVLQDIWQHARNTTATNSALEALVDDASAGLRADQISASGLSFPTWQGRVSALRTWVVNRAEYIDNQYEPLPQVSPATGEFSGSPTVTMAPSAGGTVYFTTDGSDPRLDGGGISSAATAYAGPITITNRTRMIARTRDGANWSGKVERNYYRLTEIPQLVVSEIGYHPAEPSAAEALLGHDDADDFEFIEILNVGTDTADLTPLVLEEGITYEFSSGVMTSLSPGARVLIVRDRPAFEARHGNGLPVAGEYAGALNNAGDTIVLRDALLDMELLRFSYGDDAPWPECTDGDGYSLILRNPHAQPDPGLASSWRCSSQPTGNPGGTDAVPAFTGNEFEDQDHDRVPALVEHFLGTSDGDPGEGLDPIRMSWHRLDEDGRDYPALEVTYRVGADDAVPAAEWSDDLMDWFNTPERIILLSDTPNGDGTATIIWRSAAPAGTARQFLRLRVTHDSH